MKLQLLFLKPNEIFAILHPNLSANIPNYARRDSGNVILQPHAPVTTFVYATAKVKLLMSEAILKEKFYGNLKGIWLRISSVMMVQVKGNHTDTE